MYPTFALHRCRLKKVSEGICVSCVRLRFVFTKLIVPTFAAFAADKRRIRGLICALHGNRPSEKLFRRPLCVMRTITLCFHKANRTYALRATRYCSCCLGMQRPSERFSDGLGLSHLHSRVTLNTPFTSARLASTRGNSFTCFTSTVKRMLASKSRDWVCTAVTLSL